ncbi:restriction endonuclease subunit S [Streptococcaceae bacterium ESL0687]|nr:restriction endonuclease subunit S [Streptococcaceae bacterium ESL0687]
MAKKEKPQLRFKGFEGEWEEEKFDNLFDLSVPTNSLSRENLVYDEGKIKNIHYGDILTKFNSVLDASDKMIPYIRGASEDKFKKSFLKDGDIVIADAAEDESVGKSIEVCNVKKHPIVAGLHTIVARPKNIFAPLYLGHYLNSKIYHESLYKLMQGTKVLSLSKTNISKTSVCFPDYKEQEKIGAFFAQLDKLIALYEKRLADLKEMKKGYLQKMFPAPGQKIPQLRFQEFEGEWEMCKLKDKSVISAGGDMPKKASKKRGKYPILANSLLNNGVVGYSDSYKVEAPAVTVTGRGDVGFARAQINNFTPVVRLLTIKSKFNIYFLENYINICNPFIESTGVPQLTVPQLGQYKIIFPSLPEQEKIGTFFADFDKKINQAEKKLDQLKTLKKGFLQKMFV